MCSDNGSAKAVRTTGVKEDHKQIQRRSKVKGRGTTVTETLLYFEELVLDLRTYMFFYFLLLLHYYM